MYWLSCNYALLQCTSPLSLRVHKREGLLPYLLVHTGQFGTVYRAQMKRSQQSASAHVTVAVKTVAQITLDFKKEVTIMSEVIHPNIIRLYGLINEGA